MTTKRIEDDAIEVMNEGRGLCRVLSVGISLAGWRGRFDEQFAAATSTARLPAEYQEVEYIGSTTQYLDTGIKPNQTTVVESRVSLANASLTCTIFGTRTSGGVKMFSALYVASTINHLRYDIDDQWPFYGSYTATSSVPFNITFRNGVCDINGSADYTVSPPVVSFTCDYNLFLMALNNAGTAASFFEGRTYSSTVTVNGSIVRNYVPSVRVSDGVIGYYDLINSTFNIPAGTGSVTAGPPVE